MENKYSEDELICMEEFISDYISDEQCEDIAANDHNCRNCHCIDECYSLANNKCNSEWAESIDYGGCDSEEEFWEQLFD